MEAHKISSPFIDPRRFNCVDSVQTVALSKWKKQIEIFGVVSAPVETMPVTPLNS